MAWTVPAVATYRWLYVNDFDLILGDTTEENRLLCYAYAQGYNRLALFGLNHLNSGAVFPSNVKTDLNNFITKAQDLYFINVGGVFGGPNVLDSIIDYNDTTGVANNTIFVSAISELEWWNYSYNLPFQTQDSSGHYSFVEAMKFLTAKKRDLTNSGASLICYTGWTHSSGFAYDYTTGSNGNGLPIIGISVPLRQITIRGDFTSSGIMTGYQMQVGDTLTLNDYPNTGARTNFLVSNVTNSGGNTVLTTSNINTLTTAVIGTANVNTGYNILSIPTITSIRLKGNKTIRFVGTTLSNSPTYVSPLPQCSTIKIENAPGNLNNNLICNVTGVRFDNTLGGTGETVLLLSGSTPLSTTTVAGFVNPDVVGKIETGIISYPGGSAVSELQIAYSVYDEFWLHDYVTSTPVYSYTQSRLALLGLAANAYNNTKQVGTIFSAENGFSARFFDGNAGSLTRKNIFNAFDYYSKVLTLPSPAQSGTPAASETNANITNRLLFRSVSMFHYGHIKALNSGNGPNIFLTTNPTSPTVLPFGPASTTLTAVICDDCLPTPGNYTYTWTITASPVGSTPGINTPGTTTYTTTSSTCPSGPTTLSVPFYYTSSGNYTVSLTADDPFFANDTITTTKTFNIVVSGSSSLFTIDAITQTGISTCVGGTGNTAAFNFTNNFLVPTSLTWRVTDATNSIVGSSTFLSNAAEPITIYPTSGVGFAAGTYVLTIVDTSTSAYLTSQLFTLADPTPITGTFTNAPILCNGSSTTVTVNPSGGSSFAFVDLITDYEFNTPANWILDNTWPGGSGGQSSSIAGGKLTLTAGTGSYNQWKIIPSTGGPSYYPLLSTFVVKWTVKTGNITAGSNVAIYLKDNAIGGGAYYNIIPVAAANTTYTGRIIFTNQNTISAQGPELQVYKTALPAGNTIEIDQFKVEVFNTTPNSGYTYSWNTSPPQTTQIATNVTAGTYNVTITDSNGCTAILPVTITQPPPIVLTPIIKDVTCKGGANGGINLTNGVSGGNAPYTYVWSGSNLPVTPPNTTTNLTGLIAGTYSCTVTDSKGCSQSTGSMTVADGYLLSYTMTGPADICLSNTTAYSYEVLGSNGVNPFTYTWNNGETTNPAKYTFTSNTPSPYTVSCEITDGNGCTTTVTKDITFRSIGNFAANFVRSAPAFTTCTGSTVTITVNNSGGFGYWNDPIPTTTPFITIPKTFFNANGTTVIVNIASAQGYNTYVEYTTVAPISGTLTGDPTQYVTVSGFTGVDTIFNGTGNPTVTGSNTFTLPISGFTTAPTTTATASVSTKYFDLVWTETDVAAACESTATYRLYAPRPITISANITAVPCNSPSPNVGAINLTILSGCGGYTYSWTGPNSFTSTNQNISSLVAGLYAVTITDASANTYTASILVKISYPVISNFTLVNTCNGDPNGSINITSVTGGTPNYTYQWSSPTYPNTIFPSTTLINNLGNGGYIVTITDANGCITTKRFTIKNSDKININYTVKEVSCVGLCDGLIEITNATGGSGLSAFTYAWFNGSTSASLKAVCAGDHTVTVTDGNGCSNTFTINVPTPDPVKVTYTLTQANISQGTLGCINFTSITGGTAPYTIYRPGQSPSKDTVFCNLVPGTYTYTICDNSNISVISSGQSSGTKACCTPVTFTISNRCTAFSIPELKLQLYKFQCCAGKLAAKYVQYQDIGRADLAKCLLSDLKYLSLALSSLTCIDTLEDSCLSCDDISNILDQMKNICDCDCCLDAGEHTYEMIYDPATGAFTPIIPSIN